jgi:predicted ATP-dependent endonuclease of OLD family
MNLHSCHIRNLRRLRDVHIDLAGNTTTFVGANNSGKTTAAQAFTLFLATAPKFSIHDFNNSTWESFDAVDAETLDFPSISLDLWFEVDEASLHRVFELLPDLDWQGSRVGIRIAYEARDPLSLWANYCEKAQEATETVAKSLAAPNAEPAQAAAEPGDPAQADLRQADLAHAAAEADLGHYRPWPQNMMEFLEKRLGHEYELRYYKLDESKFGDAGQPISPGYSPARMDGGTRVLNSLLRVDFVGAQRDLNDPESSSRSDNLSRVLSTFYQQNLDQHETDHQALRAIAESEHRLNEHFDTVFADTLTAIRQLGYPGLTDPDIEVRSTLTAHSVLRSNAAVHYVVPGNEREGPRLSLPEQYNGLGLNLIFMIVQVLGFHAQWQATEHDRPPVHLIIIEEPEAHLHAQVQQVFIRKIRQLVDADQVAGTQFIVTTHSSHIVFEDFHEIRYFRRQGDDEGHQHATVLSLSTFVNGQHKETTEFLQKYLRLTHCDLFFADAAVLVEGASERLLLPAFIHKVAPDLEGRHLSILEVGGAFAHKFKDLIEFLNIPCLIITDLDSVAVTKGKTRPSACPTDTADATTSNAMLKSWLPSITPITDLLTATAAQKLAPPPGEIRVAYQTCETVTADDDTRVLAGRTFEDAFALRNLDLVRSDAADAVGMRLNKESLEDLVAELFELIRDDFDKTKFAVGMLTVDEALWETPTYIAEGLQWLQSVLLPPARAQASEPA